MDESSNEKVGTGLVNSSNKDWTQSPVAQSQYKRKQNLRKQSNDFKADDSDCLSQRIKQSDQSFGGFLDESINSAKRPDQSEQLSTNRLQKISDLAYEVDQAFDADYDDEEVCVPL